MGWLSTIKAVFGAIRAILRLYERKKIEDAHDAKRELEMRDAQDDILDDVRDADPNSVSDDEIISRR